MMVCEKRTGGAVLVAAKVLVGMALVAVGPAAAAEAGGNCNALTSAETLRTHPGDFSAFATKKGCFIYTRGVDDCDERLVRQIGSIVVAIYPGNEPMAGPEKLLSYAVGAKPGETERGRLVDQCGKVFGQALDLAVASCAKEAEFFRLVQDRKRIEFTAPEKPLEGVPSSPWSAGWKGMRQIGCAKLLTGPNLRLWMLREGSNEAQRSSGLTHGRGILQWVAPTNVMANYLVPTIGPLELLSGGVEQVEQLRSDAKTGATEWLFVGYRPQQEQLFAQVVRLGMEAEAVSGAFHAAAKSFDVLGVKLSTSMLQSGGQLVFEKGNLIVREKAGRQPKEFKVASYQDGAFVVSGDLPSDASIAAFDWTYPPVRQAVKE